jgi:NAD(P)-dependent dehydrogenase (short-subunit alcohol dehydrogenase family)
MLRQNGATVIATGRTVDTKDSMSRYMDVSSVQSIREVVEDIETTIGPIDTLINNAGTGSSMSTIDITEDEYDRIVNTNMKGAFFVAQEIGKRMLTRKNGTIINISSIVTEKVMPNIAIYSMTKAAMNQMTKSLAHEWGPRGINVNAIAPGYFYTGMTRDTIEGRMGKMIVNSLPRRRVGDPSDLDSVIHMLMDTRNKLMNGSIIKVDDGFSL